MTQSLNYQTGPLNSNQRFDQGRLYSYTPRPRAGSAVKPFDPSGSDSLPNPAGGVPNSANIFNQGLGLSRLDDQIAGEQDPARKAVLQSQRDQLGGATNAGLTLPQFQNQQSQQSETNIRNQYAQNPQSFAPTPKTRGAATPATPKADPAVNEQYRAKQSYLTEVWNKAVANQMDLQKQYNSLPDGPAREQVGAQLKDAYQRNNDAEKALRDHVSSVPGGTPQPTDTVAQGPASPALPQNVSPTTTPQVPASDKTVSDQDSSILAPGATSYSVDDLTTHIGPDGKVNDAASKTNYDLNGNRTSGPVPQINPSGSVQSPTPSIIGLANRAYDQKRDLTPEERSMVHAHFGGDANAEAQWYSDHGMSGSGLNPGTAKNDNAVINGVEQTPDVQKQNAASGQKAVADQEAARQAALDAAVSPERIAQGHAYNDYVNRTGLNSMVNAGSPSAWPENNGAQNPNNYVSAGGTTNFNPQNSYSPSTRAAMKTGIEDQSNDPNVNPVVGIRQDAENKAIAGDQAMAATNAAGQQRIAQTRAGVDAQDAEGLKNLRAAQGNGGVGTAFDPSTNRRLNFLQNGSIIDDSGYTRQGPTPPTAPTPLNTTPPPPAPTPEVAGTPGTTYMHVPIPLPSSSTPAPPTPTPRMAYNATQSTVAAPPPVPPGAVVNPDGTMTYNGRIYRRKAS